MKRQKELYGVSKSSEKNRAYMLNTPPLNSIIIITRGLEAFTRMIFFKFSGISLVSVGRVRPGMEIKSKLT